MKSPADYGILLWHPWWCVGYRWATTPAPGRIRLVSMNGDKASILPFDAPEVNSDATVRSQIQHLLDKLRSKNRLEAVAAATRLALV